MRGGNRQRLKAGRSAKVARPPTGLDPVQARLWRELAHAVEELGTFRESDQVAFRQLVRVTARAELCPLDAAPSAAGRLEQALGSALAAFGLNPLSRERIEVPKREHVTAQQLLEEIRQ